MFLLIWLLIGATAVGLFTLQIWYDGEDIEVRYLPWAGAGVLFGPLTAIFLGFVVVAVWWEKVSKNATVVIKGRNKS